MRLGPVMQNRITMLFEYYRRTQDGAEQLVAKGEQGAACMKQEGDRIVPTPIPDGLREALRLYEA